MTPGGAEDPAAGQGSIMQSGIAARAGTDPRVSDCQFDEGTDMSASTGFEANFERVKAQLKARLGNDVYSSWFGRMKLAEASRGLVRLSVPTAFLRQWINSHYLDLIAELWKQGDPSVLKLEIVVRTAVRHTAPAVDESEQPQARKVQARPAPCRARKSPQRLASPAPSRNRRASRPFSARRSTPATPSNPSSRARPTASPSPPRARSPNPRPARCASTRSSSTPRSGSARRICCRPSPPRPSSAGRRPASSI